MKVTFIYLDDDYDSTREVIITRACQCMANLIELPGKVEIELCKMDLSVYGQMTLDPRFPRRIRLNSALSSKEMLHPLVHELIHLHQTFKGQLLVYRDGTHVWEGRPYRVKDPQTLSYKNYSMLPWEQDVANKQHTLLEKVLTHARSGPTGT